MQADYGGNGLFNLVRSIALACGCSDRSYPALNALSPERLGESRHIVLLLVDGLGQGTLETSVRCPFLRRHATTTLTSVFPSTTASAITTLMTGLPPSQHGLTGWHVYLEEIDRILAVLPLTPRGENGLPLEQEKLHGLFAGTTLFEQLDRESWIIAPRMISASRFNAWHGRGANTLAYATLPELFDLLAGLLEEPRTPRYIYAYFSDLDAVSHHFGSSSPQAESVLAAFDAAFGRFIAGAQGCDAWILATADHGFIDSPSDRVVSLDDHPQLASLLVRPLSGERRAAYAHVLPENRPAFEHYIEMHLAHCIELRASADLIRHGWFGPLPAHPGLHSRTGDYTLIMKDNWTVKDSVPGEKPYTLLGVHGGTSRAEMRIPLVAVRV